MCTNIPSQRLTAFGQVRMCELEPAACPVCLRKGTRAQLWTLAASTHLPATDADRSGKNMPGISAAKHEHFNLVFQ